MICPSCSETLVISERQGVEIDYCPRCRGVWLDRGELDKMIERSGSYRKDRDDDDDDRRRYGDYPRKKKGFLGELFDF